MGHVGVSALSPFHGLEMKMKSPKQPIDKSMKNEEAAEETSNPKKKLRKPQVKTDDKQFFKSWPAQTFHFCIFPFVTMPAQRHFIVALWKNKSSSSIVFRGLPGLSRAAVPPRPPTPPLLKEPQV